jgi:hypothetical protein
MKRLLLFISALLVSVSAFATNGAVQVNTSTGIISWPTNFATINGLSITNSVVALTARVAVLETNTASFSQGVAATNAQAVATNTYVIATNAQAVATNTYVIATNAQAVATNTYVIATNAQAVATNTYIISTNAQIVATNAQARVAILESTYATGGVSQVIAGGSNFSGNVTFSGTGIEYGGPHTAKVWTVEYCSLNIAPISSAYEHTWLAPRNETVYLDKLWAKVDGYNCTIDMVYESTNDAWRTFSTNTAPIVAVATGITTTNFISATIASNTLWGIRVIDVESRCTNLFVSFRIRF